MNKRKVKLEVEVELKIKTFKFAPSTPAPPRRTVCVQKIYFKKVELT
jgi:hypothetical protein